MPTSNSISDALGKMGVTTPTQSPQQNPSNLRGADLASYYRNIPAEQTSGGGESIGNALISSERGVAKDSVSAFGPQQYGPEQAGENGVQAGKLITAAHQLPVGSPRRTQLLSQAMSIANTGSAQANENATSLPSNEKVAGDFGGLAVDVLGAGELGDEGKAIVKGSQSALDAAKTGAKVGAVVGGAKGLTSGLSNDGGAGDVLKSGVEGAVGGAVTGGALGGALGGLSHAEPGLGAAGTGEGLSETATHEAALAPKNTAKNLAQVSKELQVPYNQKGLATIARQSGDFASFEKAALQDETGKTMSGDDLKSLYEKSTTPTEGPTKTATTFGAQKTKLPVETQRLANQLRQDGVVFGKDPGENLNTWQKAYESTINSRNDIAATDTSKPQTKWLINKLNDLKYNAPYEGAEAKQYNKVIDAAISNVKNAKTFGDLMDGRIGLDTDPANAKLFEEGGVDTRTAARDALKDARTTINTHTYEHSPNGAQYKEATEKLARLNRALVPLSEKAQGTEGLSKLGAFIKGNPLVGRLERSMILRTIIGGVRAL